MATTDQEMDESMNRARERSDQLHAYLERMDAGEELDEEAVEKLTSDVLSAVRQHNDHLAERRFEKDA